MACRAVGSGLLLSGLLGSLASSTTAQQAPKAGSCRPAPEVDATTALRDALRAIGATDRRPFVLHVRAADATVEDYQSERTYPPFFLAFTSRESWYQPATGVLRVRGRITFPNGEFDPGETLSGPTATFSAGDSVRPAPAVHADRVRDYPRIVLQRTGPYGRERLALDPRTHLPVSLDREEPHYLWGQVSASYVYSNWDRSAGVALATSSFRVVDGAAEVSRTVASVNAMPADSAPNLAVPAPQPVMPPGLPAFLRPTPPDSVRVGAATRLLVNPGYREGVVLLGDTLYLLDATQGEERARADSAMIARLFPGHHPIVLVVTDVAWPHVAGMRYWVARGATVVSHWVSRPFLERVLARRWTRTPDLYERRRGNARFTFIPVDDSLSLAGGGLRIHAIDGLGGEGAVIVYVEGDRFLWASDYVQTVRQPSTYATDVWRAVQRAGFHPSRVAAEHLPVTDWSTVDSLARSDIVKDTT
jgi:hypothetical protein